MPAYSAAERCTAARTTPTIECRLAASAIGSAAGNTGSVSLPTSTLPEAALAAEDLRRGGSRGPQDGQRGSPV